MADGTDYVAVHVAYPILNHETCIGNKLTTSNKTYLVYSNQSMQQRKNVSWLWKAVKDLTLPLEALQSTTLEAVSHWSALRASHIQSPESMDQHSQQDWPPSGLVLHIYRRQSRRKKVKSRAGPSWTRGASYWKDLAIIVHATCRISKDSMRIPWRWPQMASPWMRSAQWVYLYGDYLEIQFGPCTI